MSCRYRKADQLVGIGEGFVHDIQFFKNEASFQGAETMLRKLIKAISILTVGVQFLINQPSFAFEDPKIDFFIKQYVNRNKNSLEKVLNYTEFGGTELWSMSRDNEGSIDKDFSFFNVWISGDEGVDNCIMTRYSFNNMTLKNLTKTKTIDLRDINHSKFQFKPQSGQYGTYYSVGDGSFEILSDTVPLDKLKEYWIEAFKLCPEK